MAKSNSTKKTEEVKAPVEAPKEQQKKNDPVYEAILNYITK